MLLLVIALPAVQAYAFSEICYDPLGADKGKEWVEFVGNPFPQNTRFVEGGRRHGLTLISGTCQENCVILVADVADMFNEYVFPENVLVYDSSWAGLSNSGEILELTIDNEVIISYTYPPIAPEGQCIFFQGNEVFIGDPTPGMTFVWTDEFIDSEPQQPTTPPNNETTEEPPSQTDPDDDADTEVDVDEVPEFGVLAGLAVLIGAGMFIYRKR